MYQPAVQINNTQYNRQNPVKTLNKNRIKKNTIVYPPEN